MRGLVLGFLDDVRGEQESRGLSRQNLCAVGLWLAEVDKETADEVRGALANRSFYASVIHRVMKRYDVNVQVSQASVLRHRRGECLCGEER